MLKYRAEITKGEEIRYISHLDYASLMERAVRRAKLPAAYSEGFNPRMKLAFASALAVGVTSDAEYVDIELTKDICQPEFFDRLSAALPPGVRLLKVREIKGKVQALMAAADLADYRIDIPFSGTEAEAQAFLSRYNREDEIVYERKTLKKLKLIEVRQYMKEPVKIEAAAEHLTMRMKIIITPTGSVKPGEILDVLKTKYAMPIEPAEAWIHRLGLYSRGKALIDLV